MKAKLEKDEDKIKVGSLLKLVVPFDTHNTILVIRCVNIEFTLGDVQGNSSLQTLFGSWQRYIQI